MQWTLLSNDDTRSVFDTFIEKTWQAWFDTLGLDADTATFSKEEVDALNNYFYANELMVRCKKAAVRVSPDTWAGIEDRMLRVID
ncbi:MAG: NACHT C-terminal helical domain 2-containing protein [Thainema sp.]